MVASLQVDGQTSGGVTFGDVSIDQLEAATPAWRDGLPFGVIGLAADGAVDVYNATESRMAGLSISRVLGRQFFAEVGICMNNFLVAQRFLDEPSLDATIDYVLTLRMRPTPVKLRLLQKPGIARAYLLIHRLTG